MADIADVANDLVLLRMEQQLAARQPGLGESAEDCESCGGEIPAARRPALAGRGCVRCVECQQWHERQGGGR